MRLPSDAALLIPAPGDAGPLLQVWREEALPVISIVGNDAFADTDLEAELDAIGATTLVFANGFARERLQATALAATARGFRVFVVGEEEASALGDVRVVSVETAVEAARRAKFRQRWALARRGG